MTVTASRTTHTAAVAEPAQGRGWAYAGIGAAVAGIAAIAGSLMSGAAYEEELAGDALGITERLAEQTGGLLLFHVAGMLSAVLLVFFAAGLRRYLTETTPAGSLHPQIAQAGLGLVSVALLMGTALNTEFIFGVQDPDLLVPETAVFFGHWIGTVPWLWVGAGLAALALGAAGRSFRAVPTWLTWVSLVLGTIITLFGISPLQYMAGMFGPVWLLVASIGLLKKA